MPEPGLPEPELPGPGLPDAQRLEHAPSLLPAYLRAVLPVRLPGGARAGGAGSVLQLAGARADPEHVRRYRELVGEPAAEHLPLLYPHLLAFGLQMRLMTAPGFPFPLLGLVHVANEVTAQRPIALDEPLDLEVRAGDLQPHPRGRTVQLLTVARWAGDPSGEPVWQETSTFLHRESGSGPRPEAPAPEAAGSDAAGSEAAGSGAAGPEASAAEPDELHFSARWQLPADLGRRYAAISGDRNPIHLSRWTARPLGFPRAIAHGMWTAAAVAAALANRMPAAVSYRVQFRRPILLPSSVRLLTAVHEGAARAEVRHRERDDRVHLIATVLPR